MDLGLSGKNAVILGASRGLGLYTARALAREGANVLLCARGEGALTKAAEDIRDESDVSVHTLVVDGASESAASHIAQAAKSMGGADVFVGNAGGNRRKPFEDLERQDWLDLLSLNLLSHADASRSLIPQMKEKGGGSIIFVSSIFGREAGGAGLTLYNTTKSALISMAKIMSLELAAEGIRVNTIAPGSIRFPGGSWDKRCIETPEKMESFVSANIPIGRFGSAEEIGDTIAFLSSERASLITGACINVDGGQSHSLI